LFSIELLYFLKYCFLLSYRSGSSKQQTPEDHYEFSTRDAKSKPTHDSNISSPLHSQVNKSRHPENAMETNANCHIAVIKPTLRISADISETEGNHYDHMDDYDEISGQDMNSCDDYNDYDAVHDGNSKHTKPTYHDQSNVYDTSANTVYDKANFPHQKPGAYNKSETMNEYASTNDVNNDYDSTAFIQTQTKPENLYNHLPGNEDAENEYNATDFGRSVVREQDSTYGRLENNQ